jgi:hypothetical protein
MGTSEWQEFRGEEDFAALVERGDHRSTGRSAGRTSFPRGGQARYLSTVLRIFLD